MLTRALPPEPYAVVADWSRRTASFGAILALIAVVVGRSGVVNGFGGMAVLGAALLLCVMALGFAIRSGFVIWRTGRRGIGRALAGASLALLVLAYPAFLAVEAAQRPALADVSTDLVSLPAFSATAAARAARGGVDHGDPSPETRDVQRRAYPGVQPATLDLGADEAFRLVAKTVAARRWRIVESSAPKGRLGTGHLDAIAFTPVMGLPEDVTLRIRPQGAQTRVDMRSASRIGRHDGGGNAARVEQFLEDLQDAE